MASGDFGSSLVLDEEIEEMNAEKNSSADVKPSQTRWSEDENLVVARHILDPARSLEFESKQQGTFMTVRQLKAFFYSMLFYDCLTPP